MVYKNELSFLCDTFKKSRIRALALTPESFLDTLYGTADAAYENIAPENFSTFRFLSDIVERTVYKTTDTFKRCYIYRKLPETENDTVLLIGPYLRAPLSAQEIPKICEANGIPPKNNRFLEEYYAGLTAVPDNSALFLMLDAFCPPF